MYLTRTHVCTVVNLFERQREECAQQLKIAGELAKEKASFMSQIESMEGHSHVTETLRSALSRERMKRTESAAHGACLRREVEILMFHTITCAHASSNIVPLFSTKLQLNSSRQT